MSSTATATGLLGLLAGMAMTGARVDPFGLLLTIAALGLLGAAALERSLK